MVSGWTYILSNGGLRSLVATAQMLGAPQRPRVALVHVHDGRANGAARADHVHRQAEHFAVRQVIELELAIHGTGRSRHAGREPQDEFSHAPLQRPRVMMAALAHTIAVQAQRLIVPVQFNSDFNQITAIAEQLVLLRHMIDLEPAPAGQMMSAGSLRPEIQTPLIELSDKQLIELGGQLNVPWHLAWSCLLHGEKPCRVCPGCRRRYTAFHAAGIMDPIEQLAGV